MQCHFKNYITDVEVFPNNLENIYLKNAIKNTAMEILYKLVRAYKENIVG